MSLTLKPCQKLPDTAVGIAWEDRPTTPLIAIANTPEIAESWNEQAKRVTKHSYTVVEMGRGRRREAAGRIGLGKAAGVYADEERLGYFFPGVQNADEYARAVGMIPIEVPGQHIREACTTLGLRAVEFIDWDASRILAVFCGEVCLRTYVRLPSGAWSETRRSLLKATAIVG